MRGFSQTLRSTGSLGDRRSGSINIGDIRVSELLFAIALVLLVFEDPISGALPMAGYFDEVVACAGLACRMIPGRRWATSFEPLLIMYVFFGAVSCIVNPVQPMVAVLGDAFLNLKFYFAIFLGYSVSQNFSELLFTFLSKLARTLTIVLTVLLLFNMVAHVFPGQEYRFGFQIPRLFFSHSEYLAGAQVVLLALGMIGGFRRTVGEGFWLLLAVLNIALTLRYKALAAAIFAVMLVYTAIVRDSRFSKWNYVLLLIVITPIAWEQIMVYFGDASTARGALAISSFEIASDFFPLGTGFGSFGSYMSRVYYSPVYYAYGLNQIYGLMNLPGADTFISDTFWPMVLGQSGVLGTLCYIGTLVILYREVEGLFCQNKAMYAMTLLLFVYLVIQSTASAAFVSPVSVSAGVIIGAGIGYGQRKRIDAVICEEREAEVNV